MKHIALIWELGAGLGHLARLAPIGAALSERGYHVSLIAKTTPRKGLFPSTVEQLAAPSAVVPPRAHIAKPASFAEILHATGCCDDATLGGLITQWQRIFDRLQPDVAVLDFAPFALLALQGRDTRTVLLGTGFASPPDHSPLPGLRDWQDPYPDRLWMNECEVLARLNAQLDRLGASTLPRVGTLFGRADANLLTTFPELDHYARPAGAEYVGTWSDAGGASPQWPTAAGARVFAYLKPFSGLPALLQALGRCGASAVVHVAGHDRRLDGLTLPESLRLVPEPVNMREATAQCDCAILHAGHGSTAEMLLAGKPVLQLPLVVEQGIVARNTERLGAGIVVAADAPDSFAPALHRLLTDRSCARAAQAFAQRHAGHDPQRAIAHVVARIERLASAGAARIEPR